jgi:NADH-quinone oxidoreductase subunit L
MDWVLLIPALPALAFVLMLPLSRSARNRLLLLPTLAMSTSTVLAIVGLARLWPGGEHVVAWTRSWTFARMGDTSFEAALALDPVAAATLVVVTIVATCVLVYSLAYMHGDERIGWYFMVVSLFTSAMLVLVLSENLLLTFAMWEMMGLCSYLLIGFWHQLETARKASQKAFLTTRVGDLGFLIALFVILANANTFSLPEVLASIPHWAPGAAGIAALGLLWAAMGKSAQVPLHVWLPDAMAGPTPASALIHAATMVAAGVFVVARTLPIFEAAPAVMSLMLVIGTVTAVLGGLLAAVQHDVKKVLAYSTISQLGLMFVALGAGSATAALFHLTTHAFFKSLLFLGAGVIIHASHTQDMREMGGLRRHLPVTSAVFAIGALALAGVPPLAGFFSKDEILAVLLHEGHYVTFGFVVLASALTAFYVTRLWFRVFTGPEQNEHLHEGHVSMLAPMVLLAAITAVVGFGTTTYATFLGHHGEWPSVMMIAISFAVAGSGIGVGWWFYGRRSVVVNTAVWKRRLGYFYSMLTQKAYFDLTYDAVFIGGYFGLAKAAAAFDQSGVDAVVNAAGRGWVGLSEQAWRFDGSIIDRVVNGVGSVSRSLGTALRRIQTGRLQSYQRLTLGAVVILMLVLVFSKGA